MCAKQKTNGEEECPRNDGTVCIEHVECEQGVIKCGSTGAALLGNDRLNEEMMRLEKKIKEKKVREEKGKEKRKEEKKGKEEKEEDKIKRERAKERERRKIGFTLESFKEEKRKRYT